MAILTELLIFMKTLIVVNMRTFFRGYYKINSNFYYSNNNLNFLLGNLFFLKQYLRLNTLLWEEGLMCDFIQKKIIEKWVYKFVIINSNLFNDRSLFDQLILLYINFGLQYLTKYTIVEVNNIANILIMTCVPFFISFLLVILLFLNWIYMC